MLEQIFTEFNLAGQVIYFGNAVKAFSYLLGTSEQPFLILSDINMPLMSGLEFKRKIDQNPVLQEKRISFVFFSTAAN